MKKSAILLIGIIAVAIGVIISTSADSSTYGSFNDAKDSAAELHVVGRLDLAKDMVYNPKKDANYFSFYVKKSWKSSQKVLFGIGGFINTSRFQMNLMKFNYNQGIQI